MLNSNITPIRVLIETRRRMRMFLVLPRNDSIIREDEECVAVLGGVHGALPPPGPELEHVMLAVRETVEEHEDPTVMRTDHLGWNITYVIIISLL